MLYKFTRTKILLFRKGRYVVNGDTNTSVTTWVKNN